MQLLECQIDSYIREAEVTVLASHEEGENFLVQTDRSIAFPGGGGQPPDRVSLAGVQAEAVSRPGETGYWFQGDGPAPLGPTVMRVDWARRFDHMQQHTAQHILTAVALEGFGWNTMSFHLNPDRSDIVLDTPPPSEEKLRALEEEVNRVIRAALPVKKREMRREDVLASGARYRRLPPEHVRTLRMIEIDGIDLNPCGGTHVSNTAEIQLVRLLRAVSEKGRCRLHFLAGGRAISYGLALHRHFGELRGLLSCPLEEQEDAVRRLMAREKSAERRVRDLEGEVAALLGRALADGEDRCVGILRPEAGSEFVNRLVRTIGEARPDCLVLIVTGQAPNGTFVLTGPEDAVVATGPLVCETLDGRGGGRGRRFQGRATRPEQFEVAMEALKSWAGGGA